MESDARDKRNVIPRWRPLATIEERDISSVQRFRAQTHTHTAEDFQAWVQKWRAEDDLAAASDLFDAYALTGDQRLLKDSIRIFDREQAEIPARLRAALKLPFEKKPDPLELRKSINFRETDETYLRRSIQILKSRLRDYPRDALGYLEIARLYTILGVYDKAEHFLYLSRYLAPDDRVILRATLQFYDIVDDLDEGLRIIRQTDRLKFDPWIQSGEIATATLLGKSSRVASRSLIDISKNSPIRRERSELAMAMATLERASGVPERKVFQLVGQALPHTTENGFAQAIWLSDHSSRLFLDRFPEAKPSSEAYEAKVGLSLQEKDFEAAAGFAQLWVEDQPFSSDAIIRFLNLRSVHVVPDAFAIQVAARAMNIHQDNWHVLNACLLVFAEAERFDEARIALNRLSRATPAGSSRAFVEAASGFLAFHEGNIPEGRAAYERAIAIAKDASRRTLLVNAAMFWLRCELRAGYISDETIEEFSRIIEGSLDKIRSSDADGMKNTWFSVKKIIEQKREQPVIDNPFQRIFARVLKESLLELPGTPV